jgi:hypothetical protein
VRSEAACSSAMTPLCSFCRGRGGAAGNSEGWLDEGFFVLGVADPGFLE